MTAQPFQTKTSAFNRKIVLFLISQNVSLFGSSVVGYAIIWYITLETSSGTWLMLSTICALVPQVIVSLWGGVLADRYNRKHLIMLTDAAMPLAILLFGPLADVVTIELLLIISGLLLGLVGVLYYQSHRKLNLHPEPYQAEQQTADPEEKSDNQQKES